MFILFNNKNFFTLCCGTNIFVTYLPVQYFTAFKKCIRLDKLYACFGGLKKYLGRDDFIKILKKNNIYSEVKTFENALHSYCFFEPWLEPKVSDIDNFFKESIY